MKSKVDDLHCALNLSRKIIGIKFVLKKEDFEKIDIKQVRYKISYCKMIDLVSKGKSFKANIDNFACGGAIRALGLEELVDYAISGNAYFSLGMYDSLCTAKKVQKDVTMINHKIYGVVVRPLEKFDIDPDVVMLITNPYQAMRIVQGYAYHYGLPQNIKFSGNQGVCLECTATPFENSDINISLLCSNTRFSAKWEDSELGVGMPFNMFDRVVNGVVKTINPSETDSRKNGIIERNKELKRVTEIELGKNYYTKST